MGIENLKKIAKCSDEIKNKPPKGATLYLEKRISLAYILTSVKTCFCGDILQTFLSMNQNLLHN